MCPHHRAIRRLCRPKCTSHRSTRKSNSERARGPHRPPKAMSKASAFSLSSLCAQKIRFFFNNMFLVTCCTSQVPKTHGAWRRFRPLQAGSGSEIIRSSLQPPVLRPKTSGTASGLRNSSLQALTRWFCAAVDDVCTYIRMPAPQRRHAEHTRNSRNLCHSTLKVCTVLQHRLLAVFFWGSASSGAVAVLYSGLFL